MNLDADLELSAPQRYGPANERELRIEKLLSRMGTLLRPDDRVLGFSPPNLAPATRVLAFCPTPHALGRLAALGLAPSLPAPSLSVLREANGRAFCARVGQTLPGAAYVYSMEVLEEIVRDAGPEQELVLKRPFGFAGRDRRRVVGGVLDPSTAGFAARSFRIGEGLQVEPWLRRIRDVARHGYLAEDGRLMKGPLMEQRCDALGRWQGSAPADPSGAPLRPEHARQLEEELERAGHALSAIGYFGPFGIDAFEYERAHGGPGFQPRSEINARFSMGYPRILLEQALRAFGSS